jgi:uncharacterized membrane protein
VASDDGTAVVGTLFDPQRAFLWTIDEGLRLIDPLPGDSRSLHPLVSADGSVVLALSGSLQVGGSDLRGFLWSPANGGVLGVLDLPPYFDLRWFSDDGSIVGGSTAENIAFVATLAGGVQTLLLPGDEGSSIWAMHGSTVVGSSWSSGSPQRAFVWTSANGLQAIELPSWTAETPQGLSRDGSTVVGEAFGEDLQYRGYVWRLDGDVAVLDPAPNHFHSYAVAASEDGGTVAGASCDSEWIDCVAMIWQRQALKPNEVTTPPGNDVPAVAVVTMPGGVDATTVVELNFETVQTAGTTTVSAESAPSEGVEPAPAGFKIGDPPVYYDVATTAIFEGSISLCFSWQQGQFENEGAIRLFHYEDGAWVDVTTSVDTAGNRVCGSVASLSPFGVFEIDYAFAGFFPPIENAPTRNVAKSGSAIPVKFSLGGDRGLAVFRPGYPASRTITCSTNAPLEVVAETASAGASELSYDASSDQYVYIWKSQKAWANTCRRLVLQFADGTERTADFGFAK